MYVRMHVYMCTCFGFTMKQGLVDIMRVCMCVYMYVYAYAYEYLYVYMCTCFGFTMNYGLNLLRYLTTNIIFVYDHQQPLCI